MIEVAGGERAGDGGERRGGGGIRGGEGGGLAGFEGKRFFFYRKTVRVEGRRATVTERGGRRDPRCARLRQAGSDRDAPFVPQGKLKCGPYNGGASPSRVPSKAWGKRGKPDACGTGQRKSRRAPKTPPCATGESILSELDRTVAPPLRSGVG